MAIKRRARTAIARSALACVLAGATLGGTTAAFASTDIPVDSDPALTTTVTAESTSPTQEATAAEDVVRDDHRDPAPEAGNNPAPEAFENGSDPAPSEPQPTPAEPAPEEPVAPAEPVEEETPVAEPTPLPYDEPPTDTSVDVEENDPLPQDQINDDLYTPAPYPGSENAPEPANDSRTTVNEEDLVGVVDPATPSRPVDIDPDQTFKEIVAIPLVPVVPGSPEGLIAPARIIENASSTAGRTTISCTEATSGESAELCSTVNDRRTEDKKVTSIEVLDLSVPKASVAYELTPATSEKDVLVLEFAKVPKDLEYVDLVFTHTGTAVRPTVHVPLEKDTITDDGGYRPVQMKVNVAAEGLNPMQLASVTVEFPTTSGDLALVQVGRQQSTEPQSHGDPAPGQTPGTDGPADDQQTPPEQSAPARPTPTQGEEQQVPGQVTAGPSAPVAQTPGPQAQVLAPTPSVFTSSPLQTPRPTAGTTVQSPQEFSPRPSVAQGTDTTGAARPQAVAPDQTQSTPLDAQAVEPTPEATLDAMYFTPATLAPNVVRLLQGAGITLAILGSFALITAEERRRTRH